MPTCCRLGVLCAVLVLLTACQQARPPEAEPADATAMHTTSPAPPVSATSVELTLPATFPQDIYLPAQRRIDSVADIAGMQMVNLVTAQALPAVYADIEQRMQGQGWTRELAMQSDDGSTLAYRKADRQVFYQLVGDPGGGTRLAVRLVSGD
jgi:hypothetical protein